jgi:hypothetical protein
LRKFVNAYIILFVVDGLLSLVNSVEGQLLGIQLLSVAQAIIAFVVLMMSFALYFIVGCMRGFPKRVVLPLVVFAIWAGLFSALPLPVFIGIEKMMF